MKNIVFVLLLLVSFLLTGCITEKLDYTDFEDQKLSSYFASETVSNNRYIVYYYDQNEEDSKDLKKEILNFFNGFDTLEYYLLDTSNIETETSNFGKFDGEPIIYVVSNNAVLETYNGIVEIREFIQTYSNIEFDYDLFESQHLYTYEDVLNIENDSYILYYYLDSCPHCIATKPFFLPWAFSKSVEDIYFMEGSTVLNPDILPTELIILNSGTPILVLMSNGEFADVYFSGTDPVKEYIESIGTGDIITEVNELEYSEFADFALTDYNQSLVISDNIHLEYYYSPYCSHCNSIKPAILNFFDDLTDVEFYMMNVNEATGTPLIEGLTTVPSLFIVADNVVVAEYVGSYAIPSFIESYLNGEIDLSIYE